ncbi:MAG: hypothetical protein IJ612_03145 [Prevotella sp.]|nr:hypothetical protein [Prevotella sp.]
MKKLLITIAATALLFFVADRTLGLALGWLYSRSNATDEYKVSATCTETTAPVLFMGSSRCLHHYVPQVFQQVLGQPCFNAGDWGIKNIYYHYGLLSNVLTRYTPQTIVLEVHPSEWLALPFSGPERAGTLAPYCGMSQGCDSMLRLAGSYWPYRLSHVYRYAGTLPNLVAGRWGPMDRSLGGWRPLDGQIDTVGVEPEQFPFDQDGDRIQLLNRFADLCRQHHIRLVLAVSPMYVCADDDTFAFIRDFGRRRGLTVLDHFRDTAFVGHRDLFFDRGHLNRKGALRFSQVLAKEMGGAPGNRYCFVW